MIHFDFVVSDADAENIFSSINLEINNYHLKIMEDTASGDGSLVDYYKRRIEYLKGLKLKMLNHRE
jgi:hypothetical protein